MKRCGRDAVTGAIKALTERRCEVYGRGVERAVANRLGSYWVCEPRRSDLAAGDPRFGPADGLNQLVRRRYMELAYPTAEELLQFEEAVLAIKADLDIIASHPAAGGEDGEGDSALSVSIVGFPSSARLR